MFFRTRLVVTRSSVMLEPGGAVGKPCSTSLARFFPRAGVRALNRSSKSNSSCCTPKKSKTVQAFFLSWRRKPRPNCWTKSTGLCVGRRSSSVLTSGMSTPSLKISTAKTMLIVPSRSCSMARRRSSTLSLLLTAWAGMPKKLNCSAMYSAWAMDTQNPRAFISERSKIRRLSSLMMNLVRFSPALI